MEKKIIITGRVHDVIRHREYEIGADRVEIHGDGLVASDGYHTFDELYDFRKLLNANLFSDWFKQGLYDVHKSEKHSDGQLCFGGGWFIVVAMTPEGQISFHYEMTDWDLFHCESREIPADFDGHTAEDVRLRLTALLKRG